MRGAFLNCRFAVKGIQKADRSFGTDADWADTLAPVLFIDFITQLCWHLTPADKPRIFDQLEKR